MILAISRQLMPVDQQHNRHHLHLWCCLRLEFLISIQLLYHSHRLLEYYVR